MIIKIDSREQILYQKCNSLITSMPKFFNITLISETLPLGDIIINDESNDCIIIERKTLSDLSASIKDCRYEEQSYRLNGLQHHNHNIFYLIEGDLFNSNNSYDLKQTLYSAMFSINYFKGFSVIRSINIDETSIMVCNMAYKVGVGLKSNKIGYYNFQKEEEINSSKNNVTEKDYCTVIKKNKKENITKENIGEIMLSQIPGISTSSSLAVLQHFKTLPNLIKSINEDENCLNNILITDINGKSRKISKTVITNIIGFLHN